MSAAATDWEAWHDAYDDPDSSLSRRLRIVQREIGGALPARPRKPFRVLSLCAGRGDDLIGALSDYPYADKVSAWLIERDPRNVRAIARAAHDAGLDLENLEIIQGDAGDPRLYAGAAPADLVLLCGVLGNISDADVRATVSAMPQLCRTGGTVIWTRTRRPPDLTPRVRRWFVEAGFAELTFIAPDDELFSVGTDRLVHELQPQPQPQPPSLGEARRLFSFVK
jgi:hypothetical protein